LPHIPGVYFSARYSPGAPFGARAPPLA
jgi:hypothetical protein